ncbi:Protein PLASTID MOVEMENT IMPAIRED 1-RELATED 1, partial [Mucuna pruriens]
MPKIEGGNKSGGEEKNELLLKDVETINNASYKEKKSSSWNSTSSKSPLDDSKSKAKDSKDDNLRKDKKSIWSWRPLKALSLSRNKRFINCSFSVQVHLIEGLPLSFNDSSLCVYWKRKDALLVTPPAKVVQGVAEFQETLTHTCLITGSRKSGPQNSVKYEAKNFLLYASMLGAPQLDLGKHRVDLTRLLPLTLEELEQEKSSGKWTTSFRLSGTARSAVMNVSFGYVIVGIGDNAGATLNVLTSMQNSPPFLEPNTKPCQTEGGVRRTGSLPSFTNHYCSSKGVNVVKDLLEVLPSLESARAKSVDFLFEEFNEEKTCSPLHDKPQLEAFKENLDSIKPALCSSADGEKEKPEENPGNEGRTCNPVHDKPEIDVFQENLETVKANDYPLLDSGILNSEGCEGNGFSVVDQGIEFSSSDEHVQREEYIVKTVVDTRMLDTVDIQVSFQDSAKQDSLDELYDNSRETTVVHEFSNKEDGLCTKELLLQELELALNSVSELETAAMDSPNNMEAKYEYKLRKSQSFDDVTESVASEFLSMLGIDHSPMGLSFESEPVSPRECLLRQFEKEALSEGFSWFDLDTGNDNEAGGDNDASFGSKQWKFPTGIKPEPSLPELQKEHLIESEDVRSKQKVQMLEDLETEALMREWGLNEKAFQHSPPKDYNGFGSPMYFLPEEPLPLPPLAEGLGPFLQTKDGGFLRSMNPSLFENSKSGGKLIMQVSNSMVMPADMGSGIMEILQCLASVGIEKLSMQANKLMLLEDITGKTIQQISREAKPVLEATTHRQYHLQHDLVTGQDSTCVQRGLKGTLSGRLKSDKFGSASNSVGNQKGSEFASLEDFAPLAMDKIEALLLEGLRIQSGMSDEDAPSNIIAQSFGDISALQGKGVSNSGSLGLDGAAAIQLLDIKNSSNDGVDGIMSLSLTLDEWMRLDSGEIDDIDNISEHTSKLLAAHHANSFDLFRGSSEGDKKRGKSSGRKCGLLGNNFTVALLVQLRDPLRNYEPVGTPMLGLIQVERVFLPPKQKIYKRVSVVGNNNDEDDECEIVAKVEMKANKEGKSSQEEAIPQFRITEVHVAGMKTEPHKKKVWCTLRRGRQQQHQQSGSRWLIANGMGKSNKNPLMKPKTVSKSSAPTTTNVQPGDTLWSISSRIYGTGTRWKELVELNPHIRNPNIIIPNKTLR